MKVCLVTSKGDYRIAGTGKGKFAIRLADALMKMGVEITSDINEKSDIALHFGKMLCTSNATKQIVRMGPAHVDTNQDYKKLNKRKAEAIRKADGVVYQSQFSKRMCDKFLGEAKCPTAVIFNGADPEFYEKLEPAESPFKYNFLAATRKWIPQKRLKYTVAAFDLANIPDSCLWIAGDAKKKYESDNVRYLGLLNDKELGRYYRLCNALIHMVYLDACPNVVAEALVAGCKVMINAGCGTQELSPYFGDTPIRDREWDGKPVNLKKPPKVDVVKLATGFPIFAKPFTPEDPTHLYISNIAQQYKDFFESCLK